MEHRSKEPASAVLAQELALISCNGNGRILTSFFPVPDHAWKIEGEVSAKNRAGFFPGFRKEFFVR
jgi:hypothetical protein